MCIVLTIILVLCTKASTNGLPNPGHTSSVVDTMLFQMTAIFFFIPSPFSIPVIRTASWDSSLWLQAWISWVQGKGRIKADGCKRLFIQCTQQLHSHYNQSGRCNETELRSLYSPIEWNHGRSKCGSSTPFLHIWHSWQKEILCLTLRSQHCTLHPQKCEVCVMQGMK